MYISIAAGMHLVEDADETGSKPTILLIQKPGKISNPHGSPSLPFHNGTVSKNTLARARAAEFATLPTLEKHDASPDPRSPGFLDCEDVLLAAPFSPVPLTPRPQLPEIVPPDPAFGLPHSALQTKLDPEHPRTFAPFPATTLPRRLLSWRKTTYHNDDGARSGSTLSGYPSPQVSYSDALPPASASAVRASSSSVTARYTRPLSKLDTHDKLTKKFPISASVRKLSALGRGKVGDRALAIVLLDEAEGLGMDRIDRWTIHKWCLFLSICTLFAYGTGGLICAVLTWFRAWAHADVMYVADYDVLVLITLASSIVLMTCIIGITGTILNSRPILAVYAVLLWPALISILAIGYTSYKRYAFSLDRKLNLAWSQWYTPYGRLIIQDSLRCCGYYSPLHEASPSSQCYVRSMLPGCKGKLLRFERASLAMVWSTAFGVVPVHIVNIFVALLCANHVTRRFGKGVMPREYRLTSEDVVSDEERLYKAMEKEGCLARPILARAPSSSVFREDKEGHYDSLPAVLRPGLP
ncbi:hypothetical protein NM688_g1847 [Phlebia brevispora]|uniref:Uncharacterized protein n=1 Tax=Phlebia brevispora TaxID=194682 RepID=A0ACC1TA62_9APHY|nr:hypothetical protein NM688_g1847 [Phlebia brevispora]